MKQTMRALILVPSLLLGCAEAEEECLEWYCEDEPTDTDDTDSADTDGKDTGGKAGDEVTYYGVVDETTGLGSFYYASPGCLSTFPIDEAEANTSCTECSLAFDMRVGDAEAGDDECGVSSSFAGALLQAGHVEPDDLWINKEGGDWYLDTGGTSAIEDGNWTFTYGSGSGKEDGGKS